MNGWEQSAKGFLLNLPPDEIAAFQASSNLVEYDCGKVVFREGDSPDYVYLIAAGCLKVYRSTVLGKIATMSIYKPGDVLGAAGVLTGSPRCVFAETIEKCTLWRMNAETFIHVLLYRPRLAVYAAANLGKHLRAAEVTIMNLTSLEVDHRLAHLLLTLAESVPTARGQQLRINVKLTHEEIASMIGASRQTVTTALGRLREDGIIYMNRRYIEIKDLHRLGRLLDNL